MLHDYGERNNANMVATATPMGPSCGVFTDFVNGSHGNEYLLVGAQYAGNE
jgi:hypothetical protein